MKYIDAEKLMAEIERYEETAIDAYNPLGEDADLWHGKVTACEDIKTIIASLQQEQPKVQNGKFVFPKYLYARTKDNKTIDMSYAPQDMTAIEYIRNDFVQQEQLENEEKIMNFFDAVGDCGFSQHDILLLNNIWKKVGCQLPKSQVADASKMEQPEVNIEKEIEEHAINMPHGEFTHESECEEHEEWAQREFRHFYELGLNARKG